MSEQHGSTRTRRLIGVAVLVVVVVAMVLSVKVVPQGSATAAGFSAAAWGKENFPQVQDGIAKRAVDAETLATAVAKDQQQAATKYGVDTGASSVVSLTFTGTAGKGESGIYPVTVPGLPKKLLIRIQTGPAINGTDLRDATGEIKFGDFVNQIDYQDAASALNTQLKKQVLADVDTKNLQGKTVTVTGAFQLINPDAWLVTPATLEVKP